MTKAKPGLKIAIAGLGVVGSEVARQLINRHGDLGDRCRGNRLTLLPLARATAQLTVFFRLTALTGMMMQPSLPRVTMLTLLLK